MHLALKLVVRQIEFSKTRYFMDRRRFPLLKQVEFHPRFGPVGGIDEALDKVKERVGRIKQAFADIGLSFKIVGDTKFVD